MNRSLVAAPKPARARTLSMRASVLEASDRGAGKRRSCVDTPSLYTGLCEGLLGSGPRLNCNAGVYEGEPLIAVLVRPIFVLLSGMVQEKRMLEITEDWCHDTSRQPPMMSCSGFDGSSLLSHSSWRESYQRVGVRPGLIGSGEAAVHVKDKDGSLCGIDVVRSVVRKTLCRDVVRAVIFTMVLLKYWTLDGQPDRMQRIIGASREQGIVQFYAKWLVQNVHAFIDVLAGHFKAFPLENDVTLNDLLVDVQCTLVQTSGHKRRRDMFDEMASEMASLYCLVETLQANRDDRASWPSRIADAHKLQKQVDRFLERVDKDGVRNPSRLSLLDNAKAMKILREFGATDSPADFPIYSDNFLIYPSTTGHARRELRHRAERHGKQESFVENNGSAQAGSDCPQRAS
jgi:hypothetical protein